MLSPIIIPGWNHHAMEYDLWRREEEAATKIQTAVRVWRRKEEAATKIQAAVRGKILREKLIVTMDYFAEKYIWKMFNAANDEMTRQELCDEPSDPDADEEEMSQGMQTMMIIKQFMADAHAEAWDCFKQAQEDEGIVYYRRKIEKKWRVFNENGEDVGRWSKSKKKIIFNQ